MVRVALTAAFVASLVFSAFASPVGHHDFVTVPLKKVGAPSAAAIRNKDVRRIIKHNEKVGIQAAAVNIPLAVSSGTVENDLVTYTAPIVVGSQTFNLIVDTGE